MVISASESGRLDDAGAGAGAGALLFGFLNIVISASERRGASEAGVGVGAGVDGDGVDFFMVKSARLRLGIVAGGGEEEAPFDFFG
mmetsp:Transcript_29236/g.44645  ORF Transcript_29236/g.44645 Transcript_29236/m.44645 type:complete len:86 (+) Transcript_29236:400-657(+)